LYFLLLKKGIRILLTIFAALMQSLFPLLDRIDLPSDLRELGQDDLENLCSELRTYLIDTVSTHGGHFAANLGTVELTVALHYIFDTPEDKLVWDVGHQAYGHKILTGRKDLFHTNRKLDGISGFPKINESEYDNFGTGHSSTSISAILGMAMAAYLNGNKTRNHIAVIGDGSLTGGMAFEALNNLSDFKGNVLVVVNDNNIGIDPTPGAVNKHLSDITLAKPNLFENLNIPYSGPIDGHDIGALVQELIRLKANKGPKVLHIKTVKGKGFEPAEKEQTKWHSTSSFVKLSGEKVGIPSNKKKYQEIFGEALLELATDNENIVGVTPAMPTGSSMTIMQKKIPERIFDVGIAEQHAVTFSAGLALAGKIPVCHIYSTFFQRAYDQLIHDVALQNIPVVFCLDRAGNVGEDGPTHHGIFDLAFLNPIPNMVIAAPLNEEELRNMLFTACNQKDSPFAIRYPKGHCTGMQLKKGFEKIEIGKGKKLKKGNGTVILSLGAIGKEAIQACEENQDLAHYDMRFLKPLDTDVLKEVAANFEHIITIEDGCKIGGFGETVQSYLAENNYIGKVDILAYPDEFVEQGKSSQLYAKYKLNKEAILSLM
jgi:1-deoxy-D-xylulose-5-phosphate synthase